MSAPLTVYRRSQLEDTDCLFRWNAVYNHGVDDSSDYSLRGQAFAAIKHSYIQRLVEKGLPADSEEALAAFVEGIAEHQTPAHLIPELRELWMRHAEVFALDLDRYLAAEERNISDGISWAPDLVYAHPTELEVVDDKTYYIQWTEAEIRASFQARIYMRAAMQRWPGFRSYRFTMNFVRFNKVASVVFSPSELDVVDPEAEASRARLEHAKATNSWPAVAGPSCRYCELQCPLVQMPERMPIRLTSLEEASKVAALVLVADKAVKSLKKTLKAYCAANGPVPVGDVVFDNRPVESASYPIADVLKVLNSVGAMGAFEQEGLTLSRSALSKLFRQFPDLVDMLEPYKKGKTTFRFGGQRPGEDEDAD